jgi:hypothetical protein
MIMINCDAMKVGSLEQLDRKYFTSTECKGYRSVAMPNLNLKGRLESWHRMVLPRRPP